MQEKAALQGLLRPPFTVRAQVITPLSAGGTRHLPDALVEIDRAGKLARVEAWPADSPGLAEGGVVDLRPMVVLPGLVDLHAHLPQLPNAGLGAGLDLLTWLQRYIFPLERGFNADAARRLAPLVFRSLAAAGTTTALLYGAVFEDSLDASFAAAEEHGIRLVLGKVMMDRLRYDDSIGDKEVLDASLAQSQRLIERWHGRDGGRLRYAVTPRFAVSCTFEMLRESAALAAATGAYWQTHLAEDRHEIEEVARLFPDAIDYTDVYDKAGGLGPRTILAHCVHLSDREVARLAETQTRVAHCPASNFFLSSGAMPLARYLEAGIVVGLGSDVAAGPELSIFAGMRAGAYIQSGVHTMLRDERPRLKPLDWLRLGSYEGARVLGIEQEVGSLEAGKEADFILVDPSVTAPVGRGALDQATDDPSDIISRLMYRTRDEMIRGAWVRGRRLAT
ncbi:MAG: amidohydrolase family protein [Chloroflexota bacterium]|nr:amidohydrolase family protein [Chloroflexota bacterium]